MEHCIRRADVRHKVGQEVALHESRATVAGGNHGDDMKFFQEKWAFALVIAGAALTVSAFEVPADGVYKDRIDWGLIMDITGPSAAAQVPWVYGFQDYMRKVNDAGGIHARKINVLAEDDRYDAQRHRLSFERLVDQTPALGISGMGNSSAQAALMPMIRQGKLPVVGTYTSTKAGTEPPTPMFYAGFCDYKGMAQVGVGYFAETLKAKAPRVAVVHLDVASGVEYFGFIQDAIARQGGSAKSLPIKVTAIDATSQVLEIIAGKPDFVAVHGAPTTAILLMKTMHQYGLKIPVFAGTYQGSPVVYSAVGPEAGSNLYFISCFTPSGADESPGVREMSAAADKYGHPTFMDDVNYAGGWVVGQMVAEAITKIGPEPTREKLVASMGKGFVVDTKGVSSLVKYSPDDHKGPVLARPYRFNYQTKKFTAYGNYADYEKYLK